MKNTGWAKLVRVTKAAVLPVSKNRYGKCIQCRECCKLPKRMLILKI